MGRECLRLVLSALACALRADDLANLADNRRLITEGNALLQRIK